METAFATGIDGEARVANVPLPRAGRWRVWVTAEREGETLIERLDVTGGGFRSIWQAKTSERAIRTTPVIANEYVIVGSRDQKVYWLSREDGSTFFSREVGGEVLSDLLVIEPGEVLDIPEPLLVVGTPTQQEILVAFTLQNGERAWAYGYS